jgi:uncharacterized protein (TIGR04255 family)
MNKLPKAPLLEVIFELKWEIRDKNDLEKFQYLHGDLYSKLKDSFPKRERLVPLDFPVEFLHNRPIYRFRSQEEYPLIQIGPGLITLNTIEEKYVWEEFNDLSNTLLKTLFEIFSDLKKYDFIQPSLTYIDFFSFNFQNANVYDFISENLKLNFSQNFYETDKFPTNLNLGYYYETAVGDLSISLRKGKNNKNEDGIAMQIKISNKLSKVEILEISKWLSESHSLASSLFKQITEGSFYESFIK